MTPLMTAVTGGKHKVVKALLKAEPTLTNPNPNCSTNPKPN